MLRLAFASLLFVAVYAQEEMNLTGLIGTFSALGKPGVDGFFQLPKDERQALAMGWVSPPEPEQDPNLRTYCEYGNIQCCVLVDRLGTTGCVQVSWPQTVDQLQMPGIDYLAKGFINKTIFGIPAYSMPVCLDTPESIAKGRVFDGITAKSVHLRIRDKIVNLPMDESEFESINFTKQNCLIKMGQHYFYNASKTQSPSDFIGTFTLSKYGKLIGVGIIGLGAKKLADSKIPSSTKQTDFLELVPLPAIKIIAPDYPQFLEEYEEKYKISSQHIYFVEHPEDIKCGVTTMAGQIAKGVAGRIGNMLHG